MDPQTSYDAWSMQQAWQSANGDMVPIGAQGTQTFHAFQDAQQQQQQQQQQPPYNHYEQQQQQQQQQQQVMASHHLQQFNAEPISGAPQASSSYPAQPTTVDANMLRELQAMYPNAHPDMLMQAILHPSASASQPANFFPAATQQLSQVPHQHQPQWQGAAPVSQASYQPSSFASAPPAYNGAAQPPHDNYGDQSGHSLADALRFTPAASSTPAGSTTSLQATPASSEADASGEKKKPKLRQLKLTSLLGVAQTVSMEGQQSLPSTSSTLHPTTSGSAESSTEPRTPPLPPARVMAAKPASSSGASTDTAAAQPNAAKPLATADGVLWSKAKQPLGRLSVERDPTTSARQLIKILCEFDAEARFRRPVSTGAEVRKSLVETLHAIATLEKGKGFSETGRKKFFGAWMASPAGRHILSTWLRQTVPPKKVTEGAPDLSRRYRDTLLPLLAILDYVPMRKAYLTDEAGLGKAITGVSLRAVDPGARKLAESLKIKWTKVIEAEDSTSTSSSKASPPAASTGSAAVKRKPSDAAGTSESSTKRYKTATSTTATAAGTAKTAKPASSSSASAKPGLSFFGADSMKKPVAASSKVSSGATGANRMSAGQSVMNFLGTLSGGNNSSNSSGNRAAGRQGKEAEGKAGTQEKKKVKKRVTWKEDSELVAVRLIEPADYGQDDAQHAELLEKGLEGVEHDEGDALRQSFSTMEAQTDWYEPREVEVPEMMQVVLGSESVEGPFQTRRHAELEEVVYAEGQAPTSPDESQLERPGTTSETPEELKGAESVEIPTPWMGEADVTGGEDYAYAEEAGMPEVKAEGSTADAAAASGSDGGVPSQADIGALLSKVGPLMGGNASKAPSSEASASSAPAPAPAGLNFDINVLKSIVDRAKSSGPAASAVNAAMASQQVTTDGISSLLSSLSAKGHGVAARQVEESYPGEYNHDYVRTSSAAPQYGGGHQAYQQPPRYDYGNNGPAWSGSHSNQYGGGGYGGGGGSTAGAWQSKLHTKPCKFFAMGNCFRGDSCHFRHDAADTWGNQQ